MKYIQVPYQNFPVKKQINGTHFNLFLRQFIRYITKQTQGVFVGVVTQPLNKGNKNKKLGNQDAQNTTGEKQNRG